MASVKATSLVEGALRKIGVLATGDTVEPLQMDHSLGILRALLDQWALEGGLAGSEQSEQITLTENKSTLEVGPDGDFANVGNEPQRIRSLLYSPSWSDYWDPIEEVTYDRYVQERDDRPQWPTVFWHELRVGNARLHLDAPAGVGDQLEIRVPGVLYTGTLDKTASLTLPAGYELALINVLAENLMPDNAVSPQRAALVMRHAQDGRDIIMSRNLGKRLGANIDPVLTSGNRGRRANIRSLRDW